MVQNSAMLPGDVDTACLLTPSNLVVHGDYLGSFKNIDA